MTPRQAEALMERIESLRERARAVCEHCDAGLRLYRLRDDYTPADFDLGWHHDAEGDPNPACAAQDVHDEIRGLIEGLVPADSRCQNHPVHARQLCRPCIEHAVETGAVL